MNEIIIFFDGHFKKEDAEILLQDEIDVYFNGCMMIRFLNTNGVLTAINGMDRYGNNIFNDVVFKDAEIYFKQPTN